MASSSRILLLLFFSSFLFAFSSSLTEQQQQPKTIQEVDIANPELHFTPSKLDDSTNDVSCERVRVAGVSMVNIKSYANSYRVTLTPSVAIPEKPRSTIEVCFHRNASLGLCQCGKDEWKTIQKGQWMGIMSPFEDKYVDVKILSSTGVVTVSVKEDFHQWRLYCLVFGFISLLIAPVISDWVPFYYSSSMIVGVLLVVLVLLFQGMKLLPTGRKSAFYFTIYGSLVGLGSYLVHYFSMLINSILVSFGLSEDMYNPVSIVVGVVVGLCGAALGYWVVRKYVISEDGRVDAGIAQFVKWAVRIVAITSILQSTLDARLAILAVASCLCISGGAQRWYMRLNRKKGNLWVQKARQASGGRRSAEFHSRSTGKAFGKMPWASPKKPIPFTISPSKGYYSPSPIKRGMLTPERDYPSTFHELSSRKRFSKKDWAEFTNESTKEALAELASTPEFTDWIVENADRIQLQPEDSSDDSMDSDGVSSEETVVDSGAKLGLFGWC